MLIGLSEHDFKKLSTDVLTFYSFFTHKSSDIHEIINLIYLYKGKYRVEITVWYNGEYFPSNNPLGLQLENFYYSEDMKLASLALCKNIERLLLEDKHHRLFSICHDEYFSFHDCSQFVPSPASFLPKFTKDEEMLYALSLTDKTNQEISTILNFSINLVGRLFCDMYYKIRQGLLVFPKEHVLELKERAKEHCEKFKIELI